MLKTLKLTGAPEPSESALQLALLKRLHALGFLAVRVNSGAFKTSHGAFFRAYIVQGAPDQSSGFPDVMAMRSRADGQMELRLFECKAKGKTRSPEQLRFAEFALRRGVSVEVVEGRAGLDALELAFTSHS